MLLPLILASASPRRVELLKQVHPNFVVIPADLDEESFTTTDPFETARGLALQKAKHLASQHPNSLVLGGDTVVAYEGPNGCEQLAKPSSIEDAIEMLKKLSNRSHRVITGFALVGPEVEYAEIDETIVTFRELSHDEIEAYVATGEPMDKAGAYAIQGGAAGFVISTEGSLSNVIGLPIEKLTEALQRLGLMSRLE